MILLDTHAWIWWVHDPKQLSKEARETIDNAAKHTGFYLSSFSAWEVGMLVKKGRLTLDREVTDWIATSEALPFITFVPVSNRIAIKSIELDLHSDPADRIIVATALSLGASLVSKDEKLRSFKKIKTIW